ncbi:MAG: hypothetical protein JKY65_33925 [Planctomycetes bacterium]|nr:hypothetical protein [Planctomycetota bacterium]
MSESKDKEAKGPEDARISAKVLFRRRAATVLYLLFLGLCLGGSQGPWWEVWVGERRIGGSVSGPEFMRYTNEKAPEDTLDPSDPFAKYRTTKIEHTVTPSRLVALCCLLALFIVVYNLFGDHDAQLPVFLLTLVVAASAAFVVYSVWSDNQVIAGVLAPNESVLIKSEAVRITSGGKSLASAPLPKDPARRLPLWKPLWGYALFVSSALVLLLNSAYLTLIAVRGEP